MKIDKILDELEAFKSENAKLQLIIKELDIKNKLLENQIKKIRVLLTTQLAIVNYVS